MWGYPYKTAIKGHNEAYILFIGVSRWLRPSLLGRGRGRGLFLTWVSRWSLPFHSGEGTGEGPPLALNLVCSVHLWVLWEKECPSISKRMSLREQKNVPPWAKECSSVGERIVLREKKNVPQWEKESFSVKVGMLNIQTEIVRIFRLPHPSPFEDRPSWMREEALLHSRTCPSCVLKTPFLMKEGRLL